MAAIAVQLGGDGSNTDEADPRVSMKGESDGGRLSEDPSKLGHFGFADLPKGCIEIFGCKSSNLLEYRCAAFPLQTILHI